jgi:hypothetical protein
MKNITRRIDRTLSMVICFGFLSVCMGENRKSEPQYASAEGFALTATTTKKEFSPCEPIMVEIALSNATSQALSLECFGTKNDYDEHVLDKGGREVPATQLGVASQIKRFGGGGRIMATIQPGNALRGYVTINQIFDMSLPGSYSIVIERAVPKQTGEGRVTLKSFPIEIEVLGTSPFK